MAKVNRVKSRNQTNITAVFPGSFDPFTKGHADIVERALAIFDRVIVGVLHNPSKTYLFEEQERVALIAKHFERLGDRVAVESFSGLLVDFVARTGSRVVLRGLRAVSDFDYEAQMALVNRRLAPQVETLFLTSREEHSYISSSVVKQVATLGGDVSEMVPAIINQALKRLYRHRAK